MDLTCDIEQDAITTAAAARLLHACSLDACAAAVAGLATHELTIAMQQAAVDDPDLTRRARLALTIYAMRELTDRSSSA